MKWKCRKQKSSRLEIWLESLRIALTLQNGTQYDSIGEVAFFLKQSNFDYAVTFPDGTIKYYLECDLTLFVDLKMTPPDMDLDEIHRAQELMR